MAVYVPGSKGAPSFVRLYQYPNFDGPHAALANKSFFKADKVTMLWNKKGMRNIFYLILFIKYWFNLYSYVYREKSISAYLMKIYMALLHCIYFLSPLG